MLLKAFQILKYPEIGKGCGVDGGLCITSIQDGFFHARFLLKPL